MQIPVQIGLNWNWSTITELGKNPSFSWAVQSLDQLGLYDSLLLLIQPTILNYAFLVNWRWAKNLVGLSVNKANSAQSGIRLTLGWAWQKKRGLKHWGLHDSHFKTDKSFQLPGLDPGPKGCSNLKSSLEMHSNKCPKCQFKPLYSNFLMSTTLLKLSHLNCFSSNVSVKIIHLNYFTHTTYL